MSSFCNESPKVYAVVPAAGSSERMQGVGGKSKPFLVLKNGLSILEQTLASIVAADVASGIVVVARAEDHACTREMLSEIVPPSLDSQVVDGGLSRQESVFNGVRALKCDEADFVLVHDAARPFCSPVLIKSVTEAAFRSRAAILAMPVRATVKYSSDANVVERTLAREKLWEAQTPQVFVYSLLETALIRAAKDNFIGTDESEIVERTGLVKVSLVHGSSTNIKITTPDDLGFNIEPDVHRGVSTRHGNLHPFDF